LAARTNRCPFCLGANAALHTRVPQVYCPDCGARGPLGESPEEAWGLWWERGPEGHLLRESKRLAAREANLAHALYALEGEALKEGRCARCGGEVGAHAHGCLFFALNF
jgi:hypothetical protein